jgi:hypothetical protein
MSEKEYIDKIGDFVVEVLGMQSNIEEATEKIFQLSEKYYNEKNLKQN